MLAFHWAGFQLRVRYTYGFPDLRDVGAIWAGMEQSTRTAIRKAERSLTIIEDLGIDEFLKINRMTFVRQGKQPPYTDDLVRRLDATLAARNCRKMFFAVDSARQIHSALYVVWDDRCAYTLMIGSDPRFRSSNADTMLFYHALRCAAGVSASFNFCGSMVEGIELHLRSFGARQIPAYTASKHSYPVRIALSLLARS
jgi:lipid II:glycine glycyltransferase (peptidoglycan interpeptide bridge formation enzyme)